MEYMSRGTREPWDTGAVRVWSNAEFMRAWWPACGVGCEMLKARESQEDTDMMS